VQQATTMRESERVGDTCELARCIERIERRLLVPADGG